MNEHEGFKVGDIARLKSDLSKKCPMTVYGFTEPPPPLPPPLFPELDDEFPRDEQPPKPFIKRVIVIWINSQRKTETGYFRPELLVKME